MKKSVVLSLFLTGFIFTMMSCASVPPVSYGSDLVAVQGESEINLTCPRGKMDRWEKLYVYIDDELTQIMTPQDNVKIIVPNGQHTIYVNWLAKGGPWMLFNIPVNGEPITIDADSEIYNINIRLPVAITNFYIGQKVHLEPDKSMLGNHSSN